MNQALLEKRILQWEPDPETEFPHRAFKTLEEAGCLQVNVPENYGGNSWGLGKKTAPLLQLLAQIGATDLSAGRLYEGHINALYLLYLYGDRKQQERYFKDALAGKRFGIWNTDDPENPVKLVKNGSKYTLFGSKKYCSGGLYMQRAIITASTPEGGQMVIVHTEDLDASKEDASSWKPLGMKASRSVTIDFTTYSPKNIQLLGAPDAYGGQPYFSTGAVRFAAVQLGGAQAMAQAAIVHLKKADRDRDPHQLARLGRITTLLASGHNWLRETGRILDNSRITAEDKINHANMVRGAVLEICNEVMHLAEKCVGLAGMMEDHEMHKLHRDLTTYLKQPGPDRALTSVGEWTVQTADAWRVYD